MMRLLKLIIFSFILIFFVKNSLVLSKEPECSLLPTGKYYLDQTQKTTHINNFSNYFCLLTGFESFDELNFDNSNATEFEIIFFSSTKEIALDLSWDILKIENLLFERSWAF